MQRTALALCAAAALGCAAAAAEAGGASVVADLGAAPQLLHRILRGADATSVVFFFDSTQPAGVLQHRLFLEAAPQAALLADFYTIDVAEHEWLGRAYGVSRRQAWGHLIFTASGVKKAAAAAGTVARPGGVRRPQKLQIPAAQLKGFLQSKVPEPKVKKLAAKNREEAEAQLPGGAGQAALVLFAEKDKVSPVLKAVAMRAGGAVGAVFVVKVPSAAAAEVPKLPTLTIYDGSVRRAAFEGDFTPESVGAFVGRDAAAAHAAAVAADQAEVQALARKMLRPVGQVATQEQWDSEVANVDLGLVLVAFLDPTDQSALRASKQTLKEIAQTDRSPIRNVVWTSTAEAYDVMERLGVEPGSFVFFNAKHGVWTRYTGAPTARDVARFVKTIGSSRSGLRKIPDLPKIG